MNDRRRDEGKTDRDRRSAADGQQADRRRRNDRFQQQAVDSDDHDRKSGTAPAPDSGQGKTGA